MEHSAAAIFLPVSGSDCRRGVSAFILVALAALGLSASAGAQSITTYPTPTGVGCNDSGQATSNPTGITTGPDGNIWWVGSGSENGLMSTSGTNAKLYQDAGINQTTNGCTHNP